MSQTETTLGQKKEEVKVPFTPFFILTDYLVRWFLLALWHFGYITVYPFIVFQGLILPLVMGIWSIANYGSDIEKSYGYDSNKYSAQVQGNGWSTFITFFVVLTGTFISYSLLANLSLWLQYLLSFVVFVIYSCYVGFLFTCSTKRKGRDRIYKKQLSAESGRSRKVVPADLSDNLAVSASLAQTEVTPTNSSQKAFDPAIRPAKMVEHADLNDMKIVQIEVRLISLSEKVNAYIIESVLFGALAFTCFVQIISSGKPTVGDIRALLSALSSISDGLAQFDIASTVSHFSALKLIPSLLSALLIESLFCAMFFLSVIASRLRCSDVIEDVNHQLHLAKAYNAKEEESNNYRLHNRNTDEERINNRLEYLDNEIKEALRRASELMEHSKPILLYMRTFRGLGFATFLVIIITGAFIVSNSLGLIFIILSLVAYLYGGIETAVRSHKSKLIISGKPRQILNLRK